MAVTFELDPKYDHHHRIRYSIQNWLIAVSGISRAIMLFGLYLTKYLSRYIYRLNIIETLFMRRTTLKHVATNKYNALNNSYRHTYHELRDAYGRIEKKLEKKGRLSKRNIIGMVDVMC